jgi:hypothetical protein
MFSNIYTDNLNDLNSQDKQCLMKVIVNPHDNLDGPKPRKLKETYKL